MSNCNIAGHWAEEPDNDAGRIAQKRRQAYRAEEAAWVDPRELAGKGNPYELEAALKSGQVRCRFVHVGRWWVWKEAMPREAIRIGSDGRSLVDDEHWVLRIHREDWLGHRQPETASSANEAEPSPSMPPAETSALSSAPGPQAEQPLPPRKARATKRTTIEEYTAFQNDYLKKHGVYASKKTERDWAQAKGCSAQHVRDELRPQYRDGLQPAERTKLQSHSKKAQPPDDGR